MEPGARLGRYRMILEPLGAGGMGEVYLAEDTQLGRRVAVKVLPPQFSGDAERLARFEQEARAAAALNHPHIAAVFDVGVEDGTHFIVQEYLEGQTLREALHEEPPALKNALTLGIEIAEALVAAHTAGIVHRDLKPENVFVTPEGHAKVLDFGLAKLAEGSGGASGSASLSPTMLGTVIGQVMGTAGYMAPEQVEGKPDIDGRADLFGLGCVLYELLTGTRAFAGGNVHETLSQVLGSTPKLATDLRPELPAKLGWGSSRRRWPKTPPSATRPPATPWPTCARCAPRWRPASPPSR